MIETIGVIAGSGWASGLNLYLSTLMLGIAGRAGWSDIPDVLTRTDVMIVAGVLFAVEFVADKVPFLDSFWDAIHTFIRPIGAAAIGAVIAGDSGNIGAALGGTLSGLLALDAHSAKASTRVMVNASPEPVSNAAVSLFEDFSVAGLVVLAVTYPLITIVVVAVLVVAATALTIWLWKAV
ncbi:MAG TPA: DUF4126 domain-containing protein, partial [Acidimicrobiia bacterium]|nr:DUF4126 domain-containing protein [Acidimicrobiia bacterium]